MKIAKFRPVLNFRFFALVIGLTQFLGSAVVNADLNLPAGTWSYQQRGELLDTESFGGAINPAQFVSYSEDKTITYPPFQFYTGGYIQTLTHTIFAGGKYPTIDSQLETHWDNVPFIPGRDASVSASMKYNFQAWKKYSWSPDWDVPVTALMSVDVSVYGPHGFFQPEPCSAYASAGISYHSSSGTFMEELTINTVLDGDGSKQMLKRFAIGLDMINEASLYTSIVASSGGNELSGTWGGQAWADPAIQIDPDAYIDVNGVSYKASDLYGLSFSPGFEAVPEPSVGLAVSFLLLASVTRGRLRRN